MSLGKMTFFSQKKINRYNFEKACQFGKLFSLILHFCVKTFLRKSLKYLNLAVEKGEPEAIKRASELKKNQP